MHADQRDRRATVECGWDAYLFARPRVQSGWDRFGVGIVHGRQRQVSLCPAIAADPALAVGIVSRRVCVHATAVGMMPLATSSSTLQRYVINNRLRPRGREAALQLSHQGGEHGLTTLCTPLVFQFPSMKSMVDFAHSKNVKIDFYLNQVRPHAPAVSWVARTVASARSILD